MMVYRLHNISVPRYTPNFNKLHLSMLWLKPFVLIGCATAWSIEKGAVAVTGSGDVVDRMPFESLNGPVELFGGRALDIAFKVPGETFPQQIAVRLSVADGTASSLEDSFLAEKVTLAKMRGNNAKVVLPFKSIPKELLNHPLKASVMISGPSDEPLEIQIFDLIVYGDTDEKLPPLRLVGLGNGLKKKDEIHYKFPAPPRHVNPLVSIFFIIVIDALFAGLFILWKGTISPDLKVLSNRPARLQVLGIITLLELSFVGYYVVLSIFQLLALTAVLLPILFIVAQRTH